MQKKLIKFVDFIFLFGLITFLALIAYFVCFKQVYSSYDESWIFQHVYKLFFGLDLYKDINIITTPLFYYLAYINFKIFGATILNYRIFCLCICFIYYFLIFKIFLKLKTSSSHSLLYTTLVFSISYSAVLLGYTTYNALALIFVLLGILLFISHRNSKFYDFIQGFLVFCAFFSKQNIGAFFGIGILVYELFYRRESFIKNNFKKFITFIIPTLLYIIYLIHKNSLSYFINYAFWGIPNFLTNFYISFEILLFLPIIFLVIFSLILKKKFPSDNFDNTNFITFLAFSLMFIFFPLCNEYHIKAIVAFPLIALFMQLDKYCIAEILPKSSDTIVKILLLVLWSYIIINLYINLENSCYFYNSDVYKYIPLSSDDYNRIQELNSFIDGEHKGNNEVVIFSYDASLVNIYRHEFHGDNDLIFYGNLGSNGEQKIIDEINNSSNTVYLVKKSEKDYFWQEDVNIINYVKNNLIKQGELLDYEIYSH